MLFADVPPAPSGAGVQLPALWAVCADQAGLVPVTCHLLRAFRDEVPWPTVPSLLNTQVHWLFDVGNG